MDPLSLALAVGAPILGGVVGRLFGGRTRAPDFIRPAMAAAQDALRSAQEFGQTQTAQLEGSLAAAGASGFGGVSAREAIARQVGNVFARTRAQTLDTLTRAQQEQERAETEIRNRRVESTQRGIQAGFQGAGLIGASLLNQPSATPSTTAAIPQQVLASALPRLGGADLESNIRVSQNPAELPLAQFNTREPAPFELEAMRVFNLLNQ